MAGGSSESIVATEEEAARAAEQPLLVLESVRRFLDDRGIGLGPIAARRIGEGGGSNFSYLLERRDARLVLRRPPRPPLPPSAHDMVREARLQLALAPHGIRLPHIRAVCEDESVIGVPFYVMDFIDGFVVQDILPPGLEGEDARRRLGLDLVDALVEIHGADVHAEGLAAFARPGSYLERQVRRFSQLWEINRTRPLPVVEQVAARLEADMPEPLASTVVHGDYRLGNAIVGVDDPSHVLAVLDWEMGAIGDPRADVGYLLATYTEAGAESPLGTSPVTASPGFPSRAELAERYEERSGRRLDALGWFQALALWKAAVFCEAIYGRYLRGELTEDDARAARFEDGVPALADGALALLENER
jgi:aminoglycoside phosphotransferase (APT) family kinase protein